MYLFGRITKFMLKYIVSLLLFSYSISVGILTRKGRIFLTETLDYFNFSVITDSMNTRLPKLSYNTLISNNIINIVEPMSEKGNVSLDELAIINGIVMKNEPRKILEIGTFDGRTTLNMAYSSQDDCEIFTLDLPKEQLGKAKYKIGDSDKTLINKEVCGERIIKSKSIYKNKIKQIYGDSATFDFSPFYNAIELVFIDGAHDFNNALHDSETALKLIGDNDGLILWHDYKKNSPVVKAIETFKKRHSDLEIFHIMKGPIKETTLACCKIYSK